MRITARVTGQVQGVGYRLLVMGYARETGLSGFVRNEPDGSVLIIAEGDGYALALFKRMLKAPGDPLIRVDTLKVTASGASGEFHGFGIRQ